jgi:hypothetical protein
MAIRPIILPTGSMTYRPRYTGLVSDHHAGIIVTMQQTDGEITEYGNVLIKSIHVA